MPKNSVITRERGRDDCCHRSCLLPFLYFLLFFPSPPFFSSLCRCVRLMVGICEFFVLLLFLSDPKLFPGFGCCFLHCFLHRHITSHTNNILHNKQKKTCLQRCVLSFHPRFFVFSPSFGGTITRVKKKGNDNFNLLLNTCMM